MMRLFRYKLSLAFRLFGYFALLSVLPLMVVGGVSYKVSQDTLREEASRHALQILSAQRDYIELQVDQIQSLISNISGVEAISTAVTGQTAGTDDYERLATQARIGYILNGYLNIRGLVSIDILTLSGRHYHVGDTLDVSETDETVFKNLLQMVQKSDDLTNWVGVSENINRNSRHPRVITAARLLTAFQRDTLEQKPVALLLVNYDIIDFFQRMHSLQNDMSGTLMVLDGNHRLVYHPEIGQLGEELDEKLFSQIQDIKDFSQRSFNGEDTLVSVIVSPLTGWKIVGLVPSRLLDAKSEPIKRATLIALLICALVILGTIYSLSRSVITPLRRITEGFKQLQQNGEVEPLPPLGRDEVGELVSWFNAFLESWHHRRIAEQQLAEARDKLEEQADELTRSNAELESFAYVASHDMRQPLRQIASYVTLLEKRYRDQLDADAQEFIGFACEGAKRMDNLITSLLDYSRIGRHSRPMVQVDLNQVLQEAVYFLGVAINEAQASVTVDENMPVVIGDENELERLFQNLIGNALKYRSSDRVPEIAITLRREDGRHVIAIRDNGIGIAPEYFDRIFRVFQRLHASNEFEGTGIGLAICKKIAERHGGSLWLESSPGQGSIFFVTLPASAGKQQGAERL